MNELDDLRMRIAANEIILRLVANSLDQDSQRKLRTGFSVRLAELRHGDGIPGASRPSQNHIADLLAEFLNHISGK